MLTQMYSRLILDDDYKMCIRDRCPGYHISVTGTVAVISCISPDYTGYVQAYTLSLHDALPIFYNLRGGKERIFDDMNNGFGWSRLPKSFMAERCV